MNAINSPQSSGDSFPVFSLGSIGKVGEIASDIANLLDDFSDIVAPNTNIVIHLHQRDDAKQLMQNERIQEGQAQRKEENASNVLQIAEQASEEVIEAAATLFNQVEKHFENMFCVQQSPTGQFCLTKAVDALVQSTTAKPISTPEHIHEHSKFFSDVKNFVQFIGDHIVVHQDHPELGTLDQTEATFLHPDGFEITKLIRHMTEEEQKQFKEMVTQFLDSLATIEATPVGESKNDEHASQRHTIFHAVVHLDLRSLERAAKGSEELSLQHKGEAPPPVDKGESLKTTESSVAVARQQAREAAKLDVFVEKLLFFIAKDRQRFDLLHQAALREHSVVVLRLS